MSTPTDGTPLTTGRLLALEACGVASGDDLRALIAAARRVATAEYDRDRARMREEDAAGALELSRRRVAEVERELAEANKAGVGAALEIFKMDMQEVAGLKAALATAEAQVRALRELHTAVRNTLEIRYRTHKINDALSAIEAALTPTPPTTGGPQ